LDSVGSVGHVRFDRIEFGSPGGTRHRTRRADYGGIASARKDPRRKTMSSHHSALIASGPSETGALYADCFGWHGFDAVSTSLDRTQTKVAAQNALPLTAQTKSILESDIRVEERCRERARIAHELHDTLLQAFLGASMRLGQAVEQTPADSPSKPALNTALRLIRRAIDEGRAAMRGIQTASPAPGSLVQAFSNLLSEVTTGQGARFRI